MIKAKDLIEEKTIFLVKETATLSSTYSSLKHACSTIACSLVNNSGRYEEYSLFEPSRVARSEKIANRLEREFLREDKKPKYIILHGCDDLVTMEIFTWNTDCDVPYYENAVFDNREEAIQRAKSENLQNFIVVEVNNEN